MRGRMLVHVFGRQRQMLDGAQNLLDDDCIRGPRTPSQHALELPQNPAITKLSLRAAKHRAECVMMPQPGLACGC